MKVYRTKTAPMPQNNSNPDLLAVLNQKEFKISWSVSLSGCLFSINAEEQEFTSIKSKEKFSKKAGRQNVRRTERQKDRKAERHMSRQAGRQDLVGNSSSILSQLLFWCTLASSLLQYHLNINLPAHGLSPNLFKLLKDRKFARKTLAFPFQTFYDIQVNGVVKLIMFKLQILFPLSP